MCGIIGFNWEDKVNLKRSVNKLAHRGPNSKGYFLEKNLSFGHTRLSIIDLDQRSNQPMRYENLTIIFNGEIYNFKELRDELIKNGIKFNTNSDTEVILKGYSVYGEKILDKLNGMFAFAIYDQTTNEIFIARDRLGIKPLYYYKKNNKFAFSSEIKSLLELEIDTNLDYQSINKYFIFRHMPRQGTPFEYIKKLKPGHFLKYKNNNLNIFRYWDFNITNINSDFELNKKKLSKLLSESIKKRMMSDVPIGVFLSGGLDSSAIVSIMHENGIKDINTFTTDLGSKNSESKYAKIVDEEFNTNHREIVINNNALKFLQAVAYHLDEPLGDNAALSTYAMAKETSKHVKVVLSGEGNDELFAGYLKYKLFKLKRYFNNSKLIGFSYLSKLAYNKRLKSFLESDYSKFYPEFTSIFNKFERDKLYKYSEKISLKDYPKSNSLNNNLKFDIKNWLPNDLLLKNDKMTMANSLEGRVPFLDHNLVEFSFTLPESHKLRFFKDKYLFREMIKKKIPKQIYKRKKQGFTIPLKNWLDQGILEYSQDLITKNDIHFLNKPYQLNMVKNATKNIFAKRKFWTILMFHQWYHEYRDYLL